jgi:glycosyltransferase involved in cell wall biosynthesis
MRRLAGDAELRLQMGKAARARVEERFTLRHMVEAHLQLYREIVDKGPGVGGQGTGP